MRATKKTDSTIYEVAEAAGVSPATVSRVINKRGGVNVQTALRVEEALSAAQFRPRWKAAPARAVGIVIMPHRYCMAFPYNAHLLSAACEKLFAEGYTVQFIPCQRSQEAVSGIRHLMTTHQVEGVIVLTFSPLGGVGEKIECAGIPHVIVGPDGDGAGAHQVSADDFMAGFQAMQYLWNLGHRRFGVVTASTADAGHCRRLEGMRQALRVQGAGSTALAHREYSDIDAAYGESAATELLLGPDRPSAVVITNSVLAVGFSRGCRKLRLQVPEQVSLMGFEDADELAGIDPPMTVMRQPTRRLGELAALALLAQIRSESLPVRDPLPMALMIRESTTPPVPPREEAA